MSKKKQRNSGISTKKQLLYLNANLVYGETLKLVKNNSWKRKIKSGTIIKLKKEGYNLITSVLTRMEVMQNLRKRENISVIKARKVYQQVLEQFDIAEIIDVNNHIILNASYLDSIAKTRLDFKDALHITIAKKLKVPLCTHDRKAKEKSIQHEAKKEFYKEVYKPEELIKPKK